MGNSKSIPIISNLPELVQLNIYKYLSYSDYYRLVSIIHSKNKDKWLNEIFKIKYPHIFKSINDNYNTNKTFWKDFIPKYELEYEDIHNSIYKVEHFKFSKNNNISYSDIHINILFANFMLPDFQIDSTFISYLTKYLHKLPYKSFLLYDGGKSSTIKPVRNLIKCLSLLLNSKKNMAYNYHQFSIDLKNVYHNLFKVLIYISCICPGVNNIFKLSLNNIMSLAITTDFRQSNYIQNFLRNKLINLYVTPHIVNNMLSKSINDSNEFYSLIRMYTMIKRIGY